MRVLALLCLLSLTACLGSVRQEGFAATGPAAFLYSAHTNTVMTENDDGAAERLRRDWMADALGAHAMCGAGDGVQDRRFGPDALGAVRQRRRHSLPGPLHRCRAGSAGGSTAAAAGDDHQREGAGRERLARAAIGRVNPDEAGNNPPPG